MIPLHDVDFFGIYVTPASVCLALGIVGLLLARRVMDMLNIDRFVWNRALFDLGVFIAVTSGLVLSLRFAGS